MELAWDGRERSVRIDGEPTLAGVPELERLGAERHATYVVTAARLDGSTGRSSSRRYESGPDRQLTVAPFAHADPRLSVENGSVCQGLTEITCSSESAPLETTRARTWVPLR